MWSLKEPETIGVLILSGGWSERMHFPKAFLLYKHTSLLESIVDRYLETGIREIVIVLNKTLSEDAWSPFLGSLFGKARLVLNPHPELGRNHSIRLGFQELRTVQRCFLHNVDNLPPEPETLHSLLNAARKDRVIPTHNDRKGHPILLSSQIIMQFMEQDPRSADFKKVLQEFPEVHVPVLDPDVTVNINTQEEYFEQIRTCCA